jgi:ribosome-associated protein
VRSGRATVPGDMPRPARATAKVKPRAATMTAAEPSGAARDLALAIAGAGIDKKAAGIELLDVTGKVDYADFLVIMTGRSDRHVQAIAQGIEEALRRKKVRPISTEGTTSATWVLMDYGDVVVHVFQEDARQLYDIEGLWIDADRVAVKLDEGPSGGAI